MEYTEEGEKLADKSPCAGVRADLKICLLNSDCCKKVFLLIKSETYFDKLLYMQEGKTPRECLKAHNVPQECEALRNTFFECKRSLVRKNICLFYYVFSNTSFIHFSR